MGEGMRSGGHGPGQRFLRRFATLAVIGVVLIGSIGPLGAAPASAGNADDQAKGDPAFPNGRVLQTSPSPITVPASGAGAEADASIGGPPLFLPYTPPADTVELADERTGQSRTLANPEMPTSISQTRIDKAMPPVWPTTGQPAPITHGFSWLIPRGTLEYRGEVAPRRHICRRDESDLCSPALEYSTSLDA